MSIEDAQSDQHSETPPQSVEQWFNNSPTPPLSHPVTPKRTRRFLIVAGIIILVMSVAVVVGMYFRAPDCINADDYVALEQSINKITPNAVGALEANLDSPLYTFEIYFDGSSATIQSEDTAANELIKTTSEFYTSHTSAAPLSFTLTGSYSQELPRELVSKRLQSVKAVLQAKGVSASHITINEPKEMPANDDYIGPDSPIYVSLQPRSKCHTN